MRQCPKCQQWTMDFDEYFRRFRCLDRECGWMAPSSAEREIRLLRSYAQPTRFDPVAVPDLGLTLTPWYDPASDALSVDFGLDEPTFDLPETGRHHDLADRAAEQHGRGIHNRPR